MHYFSVVLLASSSKNFQLEILQADAKTPPIPHQILNGDDMRTSADRNSDIPSPTDMETSSIEQVDSHITSHHTMCVLEY